MSEDSRKFRNKYEFRQPNRKTENKRANQDEIKSIREYIDHLNDCVKRHKNDVVER